MIDQTFTTAQPDLDFSIDGVEPIPYAVTPQLSFKLRVQQTACENRFLVQSVTLRCQIRIEPLQRRYSPATGNGLQDLFGARERWPQTMRTMLWQHVCSIVPAFNDSIVVGLSVPCSYDFNLAVTKYFDALKDGEIALNFLFSGTIFYYDFAEQLQATQISWEKEAKFRLPVPVWRNLMVQYYPKCVWLCLPRDVFDQLIGYKTSHSIATWDQALHRMVEADKACLARNEY
jgi:hypothetical protein